MTVTASIREQLDQHRDRAIAKWRAMARAIATDNEQPKPTDVLAIAALLEINDPGPMLEADAEAFREHIKYQAAVEFCRRDAAAKLAVFGTIEKAYAAMHAAQAEVARLREAIGEIESGSEGFWLANISQLERSHPRCFGVFPRSRPPVAEIEVLA